MPLARELFDFRLAQWSDLTVFKWKVTAKTGFLFVSHNTGCYYNRISRIAHSQRLYTVADSQLEPSVRQLVNAVEQQECLSCFKTEKQEIEVDIWVGVFRL